MYLATHMHEMPGLSPESHVRYILLPLYNEYLIQSLVFDLLCIS